MQQYDNTTSVQYGRLQAGLAASIAAAAAERGQAGPDYRFSHSDREERRQAADTARLGCVNWRHALLYRNKI